MKYVCCHEFFLTQRILELRIDNWWGHNNLINFQKILIYQVNARFGFCSFFFKNISEEKRSLRVLVFCSIWCKILRKRTKYTWAKVYFDFLLSKQRLTIVSLCSNTLNSVSKEPTIE